jgi:hypothetical protein
MDGPQPTENLPHLQDETIEERPFEFVCDDQEVLTNVDVEDRDK